MPTYDYKCLSCGYRFEYFQKITDEPLKTCPKCGGEVKRLIGAGLSPIFKGSGFYQTDYKKNNSNVTTDSNKKANGDKTNTNKGNANTASVSSTAEAKKTA
jgi:putative FmdB family regulatory protein